MHPGSRRRRERAFLVELPLGAVHPERDPRGRPGATLRQAERRRLLALAAEAPVRGFAEDAPDALRAAAAAIAPGAAAVAEDRVPLDAHREARLEDLDRRVHRVRDSARDRVDAVLR